MLFFDEEELRLGLVIDETTIKASAKDSFKRTPIYTRLVKISDQMNRQIEEYDDYKKEFEQNPYDLLSDELDNFYYIVNNLKAIKLDGFPEDSVKAVEKLLKSATNGVRAADRLYSKIDKDTPFDKYPTAFKPTAYTKRSIVLLSDFMEMLGIDWDYPGWYTKPAEVMKRLGASDDEDSKFKTQRRLRTGRASKEEYYYSKSLRILESARSMTELFTILDIISERRLSRVAAARVSNAFNRRFGIYGGKGSKSKV